MTKSFPNFAGAPDIDDACAAELEAAGINVDRYEFLRGKGEVSTSVVGSLHGWSFKRAWRYWVAEGPGIELAVAEALHAKHGRAVRVEGHCGCPSPREWRKGFAISSYHVDTPDGLRALAGTIKGVIERAAAPGERERVAELVAATTDLLDNSLEHPIGNEYAIHPDEWDKRPGDSLGKHLYRGRWMLRDRARKALAALPSSISEGTS